MTSYATNDLVEMLTYGANVVLVLIAILSLLFLGTVFIAATLEIIWKLQEVKPNGSKRSKAEAYRIEDTGRQSGQKAIE